MNTLPIKQIPESEAILQLSQMLDKLAKLYQVPNWDSTNAILLAESVRDEYKHYSWELIVQALTNPPKLEKVWRITPDTIAEWINYTREKMVEREQRLVSERRQMEKIVSHELSEETLELIKNFKPDGIKEVPKVTRNEKRDILREDAYRQQGYKAMSDAEALEYNLNIELKSRYSRECRDPHTGALLPGKPDFETWKKQQL